MDFRIKKKSEIGEIADKYVLSFRLSAFLPCCLFPSSLLASRLLSVIMSKAQSDTAAASKSRFGQNALENGN